MHVKGVTIISGRNVELRLVTLRETFAGPRLTLPMTLGPHSMDSNLAWHASERFHMRRLTNIHR
ncbi:hypothetical protein BAUCODRAFT_29011 [Baudoinia panamericana UAMH 10762]|uniref:Uncharacterized protein n=1 Tax=Baudoinia panamericana (strain UAMH 10762) TaxID=717646 RepID=M2NMC4_BAUPA|nr:uncharacterized protein BAUCODRAFT_29011 [Baudoinia panamericana UAMH 10762]EMD00665.1 hypothetical protein BAUCODRAFT_29011 [Baudoinia panamericana UAMH 10762]